MLMMYAYNAYNVLTGNNLDIVDEEKTPCLNPEEGLCSPWVHRKTKKNILI